MLLSGVCIWKIKNERVSRKIDISVEWDDSGRNRIWDFYRESEGCDGGGCFFFERCGEFVYFYGRSFWVGLMKIAEMAGLVEELSQKMRPVVRFLFPGLEEESEAGKYISLNFLSNILGLGWAATPAGLKAMECLKQEQEGILSDKKMGNTAENVKFRDRRNITERQSITARRSITASREMCTFLIINISSLQLIPVNIIAYRMQYGSAEPTAVVAPAIVATAASTVVAVIFCKIMDRRDVA